MSKVGKPKVVDVAILAEIGAGRRTMKSAHEAAAKFTSPGNDPPKRAIALLVRKGLLVKDGDGVKRTKAAADLVDMRRAKLEDLQEWGDVVGHSELRSACLVFETIGKAAGVLGCNLAEPVEFAAVRFEPTLFNSPNTSVLRFRAIDGSELDVDLKGLLRLSREARARIADAILRCDGSDV